MGGCEATARRHSLLGLSCLLVNTVLIRLTAKFLFATKKKMAYMIIEISNY